MKGAAERSPDKCDADPEGTRRINVQATSTLAQATNERGILLIYISSDYIFPGRPGQAPFSADAKPEPPNFYGHTKLDGERAVLAATAESRLGVSLRVPVLYGEASEPNESSINVLLDIVWKAASAGQNRDGAAEPVPEAGPIKMDDWAIRYPTNTEDVARVLKDIAEKYLAADDRPALPAILQFSSEDRYTKYEICQLLAEIMGLPINGIVPNKQGNDPNASVQRPYDCHLTTKELKDLGIDISTQGFKEWWYVDQISLVRSLPSTFPRILALVIKRGHWKNQT